jgi:serine/threonine protein kinase
MEYVLKDRYIYNKLQTNFLGKGAFAEVFKGIDLKTKTEVAIKKVDKLKLLKDWSEYLCQN